MLNIFLHSYTRTKNQKKKSGHHRSKSTSSSSSSSSSSSNIKKSDIRTVFIDSQVMIKSQPPPRYRSRSQTLVRPHDKRSSGGQISFLPPNPWDNPYSGHRSRRHRERSYSTSSSNSTSSSSSSSSSTSSRSSSSSGGSGSPVRLIKVDPRTGIGYIKEGRMFVFDSQKYTVKKHLNRRHGSRPNNWTDGELSHVFYSGKDNYPVYLVDE